MSILFPPPLPLLLPSHIISSQVNGDRHILFSLFSSSLLSPSSSSSPLLPSYLSSTPRCSAIPTSSSVSYYTRPY